MKYPKCNKENDADSFRISSSSSHPVVIVSNPSFFLRKGLFRGTGTAAFTAQGICANIPIPPFHENHCPFQPKSYNMAEVSLDDDVRSVRSKIGLAATDYQAAWNERK